VNSTLKLGISPLSWTNQSIMEMGDHIPYAQCIQEAATAGYQGVELGRKFPGAASEVLSSLAMVGMAPVSAWYSGFLAKRSVEDEWPHALPFVEHLRALGCKVLVYGECANGPVGGDEAPFNATPALADMDLETYAARMTAFADIVAAEGLILVYHPHVMMPVETVAEIDSFMQSVGPSVHLLLDTGHIAMTGGEYTDVMETWWHKIAHIHLKDLRRNVMADLDPAINTLVEAVHAGGFTVPGDGDIDFAPLIAKIAKDGYDGWLLVEAEQDPKKADPTEMASIAMTYLCDLFADHGLDFERNPYSGDT
jgi:inosose dehydratase